jgi:hypothetical protein
LPKEFKSPVILLRGPLSVSILKEALHDSFWEILRLIFDFVELPTNEIFLCILWHIRGGLISLWLYKENTKATGFKKIYLLYIFPSELYTLMTSLF